MKKLIILFLTLISFNLYGSQLKVAVSIFPLSELTQSVLGKNGKVITILPPGASPHFYDPSPNDVVKLSKCDLFVFVGKGVEPWAFKMVNSIGKINVIELASFLKAEKNNFHFWLNPQYMETYIYQLVHTLQKIDPDNKEYYQSNGDKTIYRLRQLDKEYETKLQTIKNRNIIIYHNTWYYLAKRYNLNIVATIINGPNQAPSPKEIVNLQKLINKYKIKTIFGETISNVSMLKKLSNILNVKYILLDPLGNPKDNNRNGYFKLMRYNLSKLMIGLK